MRKSILLLFAAALALTPAAAQQARYLDPQDVAQALMGLMGDESQLAFALGHEVGHIAANHAHQREEVERELSWQALPYIMMGQVMGGYANQMAVRNLVAVELQSLSFSREQEYEADTLGLNPSQARVRSAVSRSCTTRV